MTCVYITGTSAGLGRAIAEAFAGDGATVGLIARDETALAEAARSLSGRTAFASADVADAGALAAAAEALESEIGPPDVWINNAMATVFSRFEEIAPEEFARVANVTFLGGVYGLQQALSMMKPRGSGVIIQIGSALAYRAIPLQAPYCAAKLAIRGAVDSLRCELIHDNSPLSLTTVHMPAMNTPQFDWARRRIAQKPHPVPPIYSPHACAEAVLWASKRPHLREVWVGKPTWQAIIGNKLMPGFMDRFMANNAYEGQFEEKAGEAWQEGNLFHPVTGAHRTRGRFTEREITKAMWIATSEKREKLFFGALALLALFIILILIAI